MNAEEVKSQIEAGMEASEVVVQGQGDRFDILVISDAFTGQMPVKRQQQVYACINDFISSGQIHAVSIQAHTPEEWEKKQKMGLA